MSETIRSYLRGTYLLHRSISTKASDTLGYSVACLDKWAGQPVLLTEATATMLCKWVESCQDSYAPSTIKRMRGDVLCVLRHAALTGKCGCPNHLLVRSVRVPLTVPRAWTIANMAGILSAAENLPGAFPTGLARGLFFSALVRVSWDAGTRLSDTTRIDKQDITHSVWATSQAKTGTPLAAHLRDSTLAALDRIDSNVPLKLPCWNKSLYYWWRKICHAASVPYMGFHGLRRSASTAVAAVDPAGVSAFLGHADERTKRRYIDMRLTCNTAMPPELTGTATGCGSLMRSCR